MMNYTSKRNEMIETQIVSRGIASISVLASFKKINRHNFVPEKYIDSSYSDYPLPIGNDQTISQPYMVALMTALLNLKGEEKVLEVGTGSGYQLAILANLSKIIYSIERVDLLVEGAKKNLKKEGLINFEIRVGDGSIGWPEHAPYDAIIVTAACPKKPAALLNQLTDSGRLVAPVGGRLSQILTLYEKSGDVLKVTDICQCVFVPLIGEEGWSE